MRLSPVHPVPDENFSALYYQRQPATEKLAVFWAYSICLDNPWPLAGSSRRLLTLGSHGLSSEPLVAMEQVLSFGF